MNFRKDLVDPIYSSDPFYDVLSGGYINPETIMIDAQEIEEVRDAICLVNEFLDSAEEAGVLEIT